MDVEDLRFRADRSQRVDEEEETPVKRKKKRSGSAISESAKENGENGENGDSPAAFNSFSDVEDSGVIVGVVAMSWGLVVAIGVAAVVAGWV